MSQAQLLDERELQPEAESGPGSLGARHNFWGENGPDETETESEVPVGHDEKPGTSKDEFIAKTILREDADILCPDCLEDRDTPVVISEPRHHVPRTVVIPNPDGKNQILELAVLPKQRRHCPDCGGIFFGGIIADRPTAEFRALIDEVAASISEFPPSKLRQARSNALAAKGRGRMHDVTIMRRFVRDLLNP